MADDWAEKRAHLVKVKVTHDCYRNCTCGQCVLDEEIILTALREAEERGEKQGYDRGYTVALESREFSLREAVREGRQSILTRLQNPDEAMVEADRLIIEPGYVHSFDTAIDVLLKEADESERHGYLANAGMKRCIVGTLRALAAHISDTQEGGGRVIKLNIPPMPHGTLAKWEHRDPATLYWLPVVLKGPTGVTCWYVELPSGHITIINGEDHAELVPVDSDTQEGE